MNHIKYIPLLLFVAGAVKALSVSGSWIDLAVLAVLGLVCAFYEFKSSDKKLKVLEDTLKAHQVAIQNLDTNNKELKSYLSGLKLNQNANIGAVKRAKVAF